MLSATSNQGKFAECGEGLQALIEAIEKDPHLYSHDVHSLPVLAKHSSVVSNDALLSKVATTLTSNMSGFGYLCMTKVTGSVENQ